jgi:hypothetical protein
MHIQTHKIHQELDLEEATTFPLIMFSMINHKGYIQMSFRPIFFEIGTLGTLEGHNFL